MPFNSADIRGKALLMRLFEKKDAKYVRKTAAMPKNCDLLLLRMVSNLVLVAISVWGEVGDGVVITIFHLHTLSVSTKSFLDFYVKQACPRIA
jgi:hypothetical protein